MNTPFPPQPPAQTRLLLVDDDPVRLLFYSRLLGKAGYEVTQAENGGEALMLVRKHQPDLVLLDVQLPDIDGIEVCRRIKSDPSLAGIFVIHISGAQVDAKSKVRGLQAGGDAYVTLPVAPEELLAKVDAMARIRRSEMALQATASELYQFMESVPDLCFTIDAQGRMLRWNRQAELVTGLGGNQLLGRTALEFAAEPDRDAAAKAIENALTAGHGEIRCRVRSHDGRLIPYHFTAGVIKDASGKVIGLASVGRDISETLRLEDDLRQAQKMEAIGRLAGGVAHDFNNLLTVMQGYLQMLSTRENLDADAQEQLRQVTLASERAANLTRQLLTFSRKQVMQPRVLNLNEVVGDMARMLRRIIGETIKIKTDLGRNLPQTLADPGMIEQIIMNLAINARDAMPKGGDLTIQTMSFEASADGRLDQPRAKTGSYVCLQVTDTGCGMDEGTRKHLFEPFFTTKAPGQGTGLGLATVYGIVEQHNGWIEVTSAVDAGTTFKVFIPAKAVAAPPKPRPAPAPVNSSGSETILMVEDETAVRMLAKMLLERRGYKVLTADSGPAALEVWAQRQNEIELVFTDLVMPGGLSGWEVAEIMRRDRPDLKVLFTSGYSVDAVGHNFLVPGENLLQKPYRPELLMETIRRTLDAAAAVPEPAGAEAVAS